MDVFVPGSIPVAPKAVAVVKYGELSVDLGKELTPTQVQNQPTLIQWTADPNSFYTLFMVDFDIPPERQIKEFVHWLVVNIPGSNWSQGRTVFEYAGSGAPEGTGLHRYTFLIYKQPGKINESDISDITDKAFMERVVNNTATFPEKHNLGNPVAGNYFKAQYDDYVPILHKKFEEKYATA